MPQSPFIKALLLCLSGFLLSFSAPGYDLWLIAWLGLIPLFIVINTSKKIHEVVLYPFLFGFSYNFWYLHWLLATTSLRLLGFERFENSYVQLALLILLAGCCAVFFSIFALLTTYLRKLLPKSFNSGVLNLIAAFIWLLLFNKLSASETLLGGFPWTLIEYSQYKNLFLIQIAEYFGSMSISFLIVLFNLTLADLFIGKSSILNLVFVLALIFSILIFGVYAYKNNQEHFSTKSHKICILQGNFPKEERYSDARLQLARDTLTKLGKQYNPSLFIFPEGALPTTYTSDLVTQNWVQAVAKSKQADIISGTFCTNEQRLTNCAVSYSLKTNKSTFYEKERIVPLSEYVPFRSILQKLCKKLGKNITLKKGLSKGQQAAPIHTSLGKAGISICFELIFPDLIKKQSVQGAKLLINTSNLKRFKNTLIQKQFLSFAVFRAIENRKPFILAVNNGISAFVTPNGKITARSLSETRQSLLHWINPNDKITFYAKYGW